MLERTTSLLACVVAMAGLSQDRAFAAIDSLAVRAAKGEIRWCHHLTQKHLRLNSPDLAWLWSDTGDDDADCQIPAHKLAALTPEQREVADYFLRYSCMPYRKWWNAEADQCDGDTSPSWCDDDGALYTHSGLEQYFSEIDGAIRGATDTDVKFNLMYSLITLAGAHVITEYPRQLIEGLYAEAFGCYLEHAALGDVVTLCAQFQSTWVGLAPSLSQEVHDYIIRHSLGGSKEGVELERLLEKRYDE